MVRENLENKTERKSGNIWKTFIPYTPFGWAWIFTRKYLKYHGSTSGINAMGIIASVVNTFFTSVYLASSLNMGTLDTTKWPEIEKQRNLEKELIQQNTYRTQFQELDRNRDYVLDSTEFIYKR